MDRKVFMKIRFKQTFACIAFIAMYITTSYQPLVAANQASNQRPACIYEKLAEYHMPSLANLASDEEIKQQQFQKQNAEKLKDKKLNEIVVPPIGEVEKLKLFYNIVSAANQFVAPSNILHENVVHDLEFFSGPQANLTHHIFKYVDETQTTMGKIELQRLLAQPLTSVRNLQARQEAIKTLVENEKLANIIETYLQHIKSTENELVWFWKQIDEATEQFFSQVYFGKKFFIDFSGYNKNVAALELSALWTTVMVPSLVITEPFIGIALGVMFRRWIVRMDGFGNRDSFMHDYRQTLETTWRVIKDGAFRIPLGLGEYHNAPAYLRLLTVGASALVIWTFYRELSSAIREAHQCNTISNMIQSKMINVATYTNSLKMLGKIIATDKTLQQALPEFKALIELNQTESNEANTLFKMLESNTFKGEASFFSKKGAVLAAFKMMQTSKDTVISSLQAAGTLDAYLSIAKLYKKHKQNANATFCFVDYKEQQSKPYLKLDAFWHPSLNPNTVVTNTIELGNAGNAGNVILTGPNAGGKSTALKAITLAVIMAQTCGIAPAKAMTITPFAKITTYLNIVDTEGRESLFQAEMRRAQELLNTINSLRPGEFNFAILDEVFTGTNPEEGVAGAYGVAKNLAQHKQNMCIIATHFKKLTELDTATNGAYKNCKVSVDIHPDGSITPKYILEDGISDQKIALQLLQNAGFGGSILQDAYSILNQQQQ